MWVFEQESSGVILQEIDKNDSSSRRSVEYYIHGPVQNPGSVLFFFEDRAEWTACVRDHPELFSKYHTIVLPAVATYMDPSLSAPAPITGDRSEPFIKKILSNPSRLNKIIRHRYNRERLAFMFSRQNPNIELHDFQYGVISTSQWVPNERISAHYRAILTLAENISPEKKETSVTIIDSNDNSTHTYTYGDLDKAMDGDIFAMTDFGSHLIDGIWMLRGNNRMEMLAEIKTVDIVSKIVENPITGEMGDEAILIPHCCGVGYYNNDMMTEYIFDYATFKLQSEKKQFTL